MPALPSSDTLSHSLVDQQVIDKISTARPAGYFGIEGYARNDTEVDNLEANWQAAIDYCASTFGGGVYFADGARYSIPTTLEATPYLSFTGSGNRDTATLHMSTSALPTSAADWPVMFTTDKVDAPARIHMSNLKLDGGWNKRGYIGEVGSVDWSIDPTRMTGHLLDIFGGSTGASGGPSHPDIHPDDGLLDPYNVFTNLWLENCAGSAMVLTGRGENMVTNININDAAIYGMFIECYDSFFNMVSAHNTGDSGVVFASGGHVATLFKSWFTGKQRRVEPQGHGFEFTASGSKGVLLASSWAQDNYGAGASLTGIGHMLKGFRFDHPGGGRLEDGNGGFTSTTGGPDGTGGQTRTVTRSALYLNGAKNCRVDGFLSGGDLSAVAPVTVEIDGSGTTGNVVDFIGEQTVEFTVAPDVAAGAADNPNEVWFNRDLVHGRVTPTDLANPVHPINTDQPPMIAYTDDGAGVRSQAIRQEDGSWLILSGDQDLSGYALTASLGALASLSTVDTAQIDDDAVTTAKLSATGTASSSTFLRGDGSWAAPAGGGGGDLLAANNLSDVASPAAALSNLGGAAALGADDNYVTDAEKVVIGNTSGTNTGDQDLSGKADLGANVFTGTQDFNGQQVEGMLNKIVASVTGTLTAADHSGNVLETSGNVTVPTTAGFNCVLVAGGAHTVTFNSTTSAAMAAGDLMTLIVEDATTIHAVLTAAADKVTFS